jgi:hypothetical protein
MELLMQTKQIPQLNIDEQKKALESILEVDPTAPFKDFNAALQVSRLKYEIVKNEEERKELYKRVTIDRIMFGLSSLEPETLQRIILQDPKKVRDIVFKEKKSALLGSNVPVKESKEQKDLLADKDDIPALRKEAGVHYLKAYIASCSNREILDELIRATRKGPQPAFEAAIKKLIPAIPNGIKLPSYKGLLSDLSIRALTLLENEIASTQDTQTVLAYLNKKSQKIPNQYSKYIKHVDIANKPEWIDALLGRIYTKALMAGRDPQINPADIQGFANSVDKQALTKFLAQKRDFLKPLDQIVTDENWKTLRATAAEYILQSKIQKSRDVGILKAISDIKNPVALMNALENDKTLELNSTADRILRMSITETALPALKVAAEVKHNMLTGNIAQLQAILCIPDFVEAYIATFNHLASETQKSAIREYFKDASYIASAQQVALERLAKLRLAELSGDELKNINAQSLLKYLSPNGMQPITGFLIKEKPINNYIALETRLRDVELNAKAFLSLSQKYAKSATKPDKYDAAVGQYTKEVIEHLRNTGEFIRQLPEEKEYAQFRIAQILVRNFPPILHNESTRDISENALMSLARVTTVDGLKKILKDTFALEDLDWVTSENMPKIQEAARDRAFDVHVANAFPSDAPAVHQNKINLIKSLSNDKQVDLLAKPKILNSLVEARTPDDVRRILGEKGDPRSAIRQGCDVYMLRELPNIKYATTTYKDAYIWVKSTKPGVSDSLYLAINNVFEQIPDDAAQKIINELEKRNINLNEKFYLSTEDIKYIIGPIAAIPNSHRLVNKLLQESTRQRDAATIQNSAIAKMVAGFPTPLELNIQKLNETLCDTEVFKSEDQKVNEFLERFFTNNQREFNQNRQEILSQYRANKNLINQNRGIKDSQSSLLEFMLSLEKGKTFEVLRQPAVIAQPNQPAAAVQPINVFEDLLIPMIVKAQTKEDLIAELRNNQSILGDDTLLASFEKKLTTKLFDKIRHDLKSIPKLLLENKAAQNPQVLMHDNTYYDNRDALLEEEKEAKKELENFKNLQTKFQDIESELAHFTNIKTIDWLNPAFQHDSQLERHYKNLAHMSDSLLSYYKHLQESLERKLQRIPNIAFLKQCEEVGIANKEELRKIQEYESYLKRNWSYIDAYIERFQSINKAMYGDSESNNELMKKGMLQALADAKNRPGVLFKTFKYEVTYIPKSEKEAYRGKPTKDADGANTNNVIVSSQSADQPKPKSYRLTKSLEADEIATYRVICDDSVGEFFEEQSGANIKGTPNLVTEVKTWPKGGNWRDGQTPDPADIEFAFAVVMQHSIARGKPTEADPISLTGGTEKQQQLVWTVCRMCGIDSSAIEVNSLVFNPANEEVGLLKWNTYFLKYAMKKDSLYTKLKDVEKVPDLVEGIKTSFANFEADKKKAKEQQEKGMIPFFKDSHVDSGRKLSQFYKHGILSKIEKTVEDTEGQIIKPKIS